jgi:hypothetical protein
VDRQRSSQGDGSDLNQLSPLPLRAEVTVPQFISRCRIRLLSALAVMTKRKPSPAVSTADRLWQWRPGLIEVAGFEVLPLWPPCRPRGLLFGPGGQGDVAHPGRLGHRRDRSSLRVQQRHRVPLELGAVAPGTGRRLSSRSVALSHPNILLQLGLEGCPVSAGRFKLAHGVPTRAFDCCPIKT